MQLRSDEPGARKGEETGARKGEERGKARSQERGKARSEERRGARSEERRGARSEERRGARSEERGARSEEQGKARSEERSGKCSSTSSTRPACGDMTDARSAARLLRLESGFSSGWSLRQVTRFPLRISAMVCRFEKALVGTCLSKDHATQTQRRRVMALGCQTSIPVWRTGQ